MVVNGTNFVRFAVSLLLLGSLAAISPVQGATDASRYLSPDELQPGMKGFGRTVMSGTRIETFEFEIISVMRNAWAPKQDVILVRCSGLNLEHSGIIGGMSGSPCYVRDDQGHERMIGAIAYGWSFSKDPVCGVQPITQMLPIPDIRQPKDASVPTTLPAEAPSGNTPIVPVATEHRHENGANTAQPLPVSALRETGHREPTRTGTVDVAEVIARKWTQPIDPASRFSVFNDRIEQRAMNRNGESAGASALPMEQLRPLSVPVMVTGGNPRAMNFLRQELENYNMVPMSGGGVGANAGIDIDNVKLQPGSVLCVPLITGDLIADALGTCTEVDGDRVLGFGHPLFSRGAVRLPLATGMVHTVVASVARSNKMGAALKSVGTLWGDESTGIFGMCGPSPQLIPLEVVINEEKWGQTDYHYEVVDEETITALLMSTGVMQSLYAHSDPPDEHSVRYAIDVEFDGIGTFKTTNFTSQEGTAAVWSDLVMPTISMQNSPFGKCRIVKAKVEVTIQQGAREGNLDQATLPRSVYKPGEKMTVDVRWQHYRSQPTFTHATYDFTLPSDLPDGTYELTLGSATTQLNNLRGEKPHLFQVRSLSEMLAALNLIGGFQGDRLYLRLKVPRGGMAIQQTEMPALPSYMRKIHTDAHRTDIREYSDALVVNYPVEFAVSGQQSVSFQVSRRDN